MKHCTHFILSEVTSDKTDMEHFFCNFGAPTINETHQTKAELPLQLPELINALMAMQSGKTPGPDGYPIEFFKTFSKKLSPIPLEMFMDSLPCVQ